MNKMNPTYLNLKSNRMTWKKIKETEVYKGWRGIIQKQFKLPDGKIADFDVVNNSPYVSIAAFTNTNKVILVRQFRPGPEHILVSFPEGYIDKSETPAQAAARELLEETGFQAQNIQFLRAVKSAYSTEIKYCLVATGCKKISSQNLDVTENIEVFTMSIEAFRIYLLDSKVDDFVNTGLGYMALDHLGLL